MNSIAVTIAVIAAAIIVLISSINLYIYKTDKAFIDAGYQRILVPAMFKEVWSKDGINPIKQ